uniref:U3 small nucleolar ribonucleoprotein protein IMP3 n=1 Tax=Hirondellea gigas TaxID=1518452 RepID=A0A2P2I255_9CRUS
MRKLTFSENKLLKHTDFFNWQVSNSVHESKILARFHIEKRHEYVLYNKLSRQARLIGNLIMKLDQEDPVRLERSAQLIEKMYSIGLIPLKGSLEQVDRINASCFCRRRLGVVMVRIKMVPTLKVAVSYIKHGHVRVGMDIIQDPAYLVTRSMEDYITWTDSSAIKKRIAEYNDMRDDFELMNC